MPQTASYPLLWSSDDFNSIPNGRFRVTTGDGVFDFAIYTVQNGSLVDQRIIKVRHSGSRAYKGFGFIMSDGKIKLWRSQSHLANSPGIFAANRLLGFLVSEELCNPVRVRIPPTIYALDAVGTFQIVFQNACIRCNSPLHDRESFWCEYHETAIPDLARDIERDERVMRYESRRARQSEGRSDDLARFRDLSGQQGPIHIRPVTASNVTTTPILPLSENGTGLVR